MSRAQSAANVTSPLRLWAAVVESELSPPATIHEESRKPSELRMPDPTRDLEQAKADLVEFSRKRSWRFGPAAIPTAQ